MGQMIGADVAELRRLAMVFDQSAERMNALTGKVGHGVQLSAWVGPVAVRFRHEWDSAHSVRLREAGAALADQASQLRKHADQQERASGSSGGGSTASTGVSGGGGGGGGGGGARSGGGTSAEDVWRRVADGVNSTADVAKILRDAELDGIKPSVAIDLLSKVAEQNPSLKRFLLPLTVANAAADGSILFAEDSTLWERFDAVGGLISVAGPVGALGGTAIHYASIAGEKAVEADWSAEGFGYFLRGLSDPDIVVDALVEDVIPLFPGAELGVAVGEKIGAELAESTHRVSTLVSDSVANSDFSTEGMQSTFDYAVKNPGVVGEEIQRASGKVFNAIFGR